MQPIAQNRCGYTGYTCNFTYSLPEAFQTNDFTFDASVDTVPTSTSWDTRMDNYYNLPTLVLGSVLTADLMQDMRFPSTDPGYEKYPELTCPVSTSDPNADMYNSYQKTSSTATNGRIKYRTEVNPSTTTPSSYTDISSAFVNTVSVSSGTVTEKTMFPGILEPMLDVELPAVGVTTITNMDAALDGIMMANIKMTQWRDIINSNVNVLFQKVRHISSLRNLLISENLESRCNQFQIKQTLSGTKRRVVLYEDSDSTAVVTYKITGGTVTINDVPVVVPGLSPLGSFDPGERFTDDGEHITAYLNVLYANSLAPNATISSTPTEYLVARIGDTKEWVNTAGGTVRQESGEWVEIRSGSVTGRIPALYSLELGGIRKIVGGAQSARGMTPTGNNYTLYNIYQETCEVEPITFTGGTEGFLYKKLPEMSGSGSSAKPSSNNLYITIEAGTCTDETAE